MQFQESQPNAEINGTVFTNYFDYDLMMMIADTGNRDLNNNVLM